MKNLLLFTLFLVEFAPFSNAQNLVDGNFTAQKCGVSKPQSTDIQALKESCYLTNWSAVEGTKPQLKNTEDEPAFSLDFGTRILKNKTIRVHRDYLKADFDTTLEKGIWYEFTAEIKANSANNGTIGISDFEVFFGTKDVTAQLSPWQNKGVRPQIRQQEILVPYVQFDYKNKWKTIKRYYKSEGGERYLIIGNFQNVPYESVNISGKPFDIKTGNVRNAAYWVRRVNLKKIEPPKSYLNEIPDAVRTGDKIVINTIEFETAKAEIPPSAYAQIETLAQILIANHAKVHIIGHTDSVGDAKSNQRLSENRALSLTKLLEKLGMPPENISYEGKGETNPIGDNTTQKGQQQNRRVEIKVIEVK